MSILTPLSHQYAYVYIILTPNEYYTELPALASNAASNKPRLAASASHCIYIAQCSIYTLLRCSIMTVLSLRNILFFNLGKYRAEVVDTAVCTPDFAVLPCVSFRLAPLIL